MARVGANVTGQIVVVAVSDMVPAREGESKSMPYHLNSRPKAFALGAVLAVVGAGGVAWACADESCQPNWSLASPSYDCAGRAAITPGNDTRINILWLMRSLKPVADKGAAYPKADYDNRQFGHTFLGWAGLRAALWPAPAAPADAAAPAPACTPSSDFAAALAGERGVSEAERAALLKLRAQVGCEGKVDWGTASVSSPAAREYWAYLKAADAFYTGDFATARSGFAALAHAHSKWVAETAAYMPIRIALRAAVAGASGQYGDFDAAKVNKPAVAQARAAIAAYLRAYPQGRYADSARGLVRRVLWLEGNQTELARIYEGLLTQTPADSEASADLAEEIDLRVLGTDAGNGAKPAADFAHAGGTPLLLAIGDLAAMRQSEAGKPLPLSAADLAAQQGQFAGHEDLYGFLAASRSFYAGEDPKGVMAMIPDAAHQPHFTPLAFSRQVLRGQALAKAHDPNEAGFWRDLLTGANPLYQRPLVELGLALRWQRDGRADQALASASPVQDPTTREILAQTLASPATLRAEARDSTRPAHERDIARFTLLHKDLTHGAYASFANDVALVPAGANIDAGMYNFAEQEGVPTGLFTRGKWAEQFPCPALTQTAATLARAPGDTRAALCLGEFWRLNGFDQFGLFSPGKDAGALGFGREMFPGKPLTRDAIYAAVIADHAAAADLRAYALYRMVRCYAPAGNNGCGGPGAGSGNSDVPKAQRKAWFDELRAKYPGSPWAKELRFYW